MKNYILAAIGWSLIIGSSVFTYKIANKASDKVMQSLEKRINNEKSKIEEKTES